MPGSSRQVMTIVSCLFDVSGATQRLAISTLESWQVVRSFLITQISTVSGFAISTLESWQVVRSFLITQISTVSGFGTQRDGLFFYSVGRDKHGSGFGTHQQP